MKICDDCGYQNEFDDNFCGNCGKNFGTIDLNEVPEPSTKKIRGIGEFLYLIYWVILLIVMSIILGILYMIFGFWIELISFIITLFIIIGCIGQAFTALFDWYRENNELKKRKKIKKKLFLHEV